ncbi:DUF2958 domain-containing protein [Nocardioides sp. Root140]|uniref:DUF2958 domain-containing protein n=1 Tax=Nocardioides sp. Root140 TaxID=1736460 RepID=UPI0006FCA5D2|nr:DUF2958 domain-containing protein [Nocardioides sp. Root140]KQY61826.1 hypothetical protein ASD30_25120 [Nocardioides sp. Root140]
MKATDALRGHTLLPPADVLAQVPALYATDGVRVEEKLIHARFYCGAATWLMAEFDGEQLAFGYCDLGLGFPEWGYFSIQELHELLVVKEGIPIYVERDLAFVARPFGAIRQ